MRRRRGGISSLAIRLRSKLSSGFPSAIAKLGRRFDEVVKKLGSHPYLQGESFSIADAYLFTVVSWSHYLKVDLSRWPAQQQ